MATTALEILLKARDDASGVINQAGRNIQRSLKDAEGASRGFAGGLLAVGAAAIGLGAVGASYAGQLESLQIALETVTGDTEAARKAMIRIREEAARSPFFETQTLAQFTQLMAASGQSIEDAVQAALRFGDVAAAFGKSNQEMSRMGNTLSQVIGKGRADVIDFRELVNAGWVSVRKDVAETMGVTMAQFEEMVTNGEVGYDQIRQAAEKFTGSAQKQSRTWGALLQRMTESFQTFMADLVVDTGIFDALKGTIEGIVRFMDEHGDEIGRSIKGFIQWSINNWPILVGIIVGGLTPAIYALATAFGAAVLSLAPFLIAGAAIGALAKVIMDNWTPIREFFTNIWTSVTNFVNEHRVAIMVLMAIFTPLLAVVVGAITLIIQHWDSITQAVGRVWTFITDATGKAIQWVVDKVTYMKDHFWESIGFIIGFFATLPFKLPFYVADAVVKIIRYLASVNWGAVFASIGQAFSNVWDWVRNAAVNAFNFIKNLNWGQIFSGIGRGIGNAVIGMIEGAINGAISGIPGIGKISLPRFANGTNFAPGGMAIVGERGPELVNLPRGSQVIPNHRLGGAGGFTIQNLTINNHTPNTNQSIMADLGWEISRRIAA